MGDSIIGVQALSAALELGAIAEKPVLFRLPGLPDMVQGVYRAAAGLCEVRDLPWDLAAPDQPFPPASRFARVIDIRDFAFDPAFCGVAMIDYFLRALGLDPAAVPPALRRNAWLAQSIEVASPPSLPRGYALVCPRTSMALRTMPEEAHRAVVTALAGLGLPVVTQGEPQSGAIAAPAPADFPALCGLVAGAALMVSADTAMPHLADAFAVPCLTFFTTHRPEWRMRDYPHARAIHLPPAGFPEALEFSRGPEDEAAARQAWLRGEAGMQWIGGEVAHFAASVPRTPHL